MSEENEVTGKARKLILELALELGGLQHRILALEADCRTLEMGQADALALVLSHEGHIAKLESEIDQLNGRLMISEGGCECGPCRAARELRGEGGNETDV